MSPTWIDVKFLHKKIDRQEIVIDYWQQAAYRCSKLLHRTRTANDKPDEGEIIEIVDEILGSGETPDTIRNDHELARGAE
jgi:hypothetical protein